MKAEDIHQRLLEAMPGAKVKAHDMTGGGDHWQLNIEAAEFKGKSMVQQHQLVYKALGDWMKKDIHALAINAKVPEDS